MRKQKSLTEKQIEELLKSKYIEKVFQKIDEYIYYYNNRRYQWGLNKMTPCEYRKYLEMSYRPITF